MKHLLLTTFCLLGSSYLYAQSNVGIGTSSPAEKLDVIGNIKADTLKGTHLLITNGASNGKVLTSDANGNASWQNAGGATSTRNGLYTNNNGIGLGGVLDTATVISLFNKGYSLNDINQSSIVTVASNAVFTSSVALSPTTPLIQTFTTTANCLTGNVELNITALTGSSITLNVLDNNNSLLATNTQSFSTLTSGLFTFPVSGVSIVAGQTYKLSITGTNNAFINYEPSTNPYIPGSATSIGINADIAFNVNAFLEETTLKIGGSKVGIGTSTPAEKLEVVGKTKTSTLQMTVGAGTNKVLVSDVAGNGSWTNSNTIPGTIVTTTNIAGSVTPAAVPVGTTFEFIGPNVSVTLAANQRVVMNLMGGLGRSTPNTTLASVDLDVGYQLLPSGSIVNAVGFSYVSIAPVYTMNNERKQYVFTGSFKPGVAGTYRIGALLRSSVAGFFNSNDFLSGYYMIINE